MTDVITLPDTLVVDAAEAFDRYRFAVENRLLIQGGWHAEEDGRHLACALGVLGRPVDSASKCPASVMPRWLALMVPNVFDRLSFEDATAWGMALYEQLARLKGQVPFSVVYDWQANCVLEFWAGSLKKRKFSPEVLAEKLAAVESLVALHRRHLAGETAPKAEWREVLRKVYAYAYADADAYAYAYADADAYAYADADADAYAYADADAEPTAPAPGETRADLVKRRRAENLKLLADGLVAALARAPAPEAAAA